MRSGEDGGRGLGDALVVSCRGEKNGAWRGCGAERLSLCWISFWFLRREMTRRGWWEGSAEADK